MIKIYTTYFAKVKKLPSHIVPISICAKPPEGFQGAQYRELKPTYNTLMDYKNTGDWEKFVERYKAETLSKLDVRTVINDLKVLGCGKDVALVCYEKSSDHCHRQIVAEWFREYGEECNELNV